MPKFNKILSPLALLAALLGAGCNEAERNQASASCKTQYVGREKAACDFGVKLANSVVHKADGMTPTQKYQTAVKGCQRLEQPLVPFCVSGIKKFRTELLAKLGRSEDGRSRSPASVFLPPP